MGTLSFKRVLSVLGSNLFLKIFIVFPTLIYAQQNKNITLDEYSPYFINEAYLGRPVIGGDTIFISSTRTKPLRFQFIEGDSLRPVVVVNKGGQVKIDGVSDNAWGALLFESCKYIKLSGKGHPGFRYGFQLGALQAGLALIEFSSDCEVENIKISHDGFFGIDAKKDYGGNPPVPYPVFDNLIIHDCFIENVSEGMYIGETKSPGMEFRNLKIYNNIVRNTGREAIQIANATEGAEVYNNTLINSGLEGTDYQMNNLQIGGNSVALVYNNIIMTAPYFGVINMGKGDVHVFHNFIQNNRGMFIDNRYISDTTMTMSIKNNYFKDLNYSEVIRNMNEFNAIEITDNIYDTNILFYKDLNNVDNEVISGNTLGPVAGIEFVNPAANDYTLAEGTAVEYLGMGATSGPEFFPYDDPETTARQLVITPDMVTDNVQGGSVYSPLYLFDEQKVNADANEHPLSKSWKPYYVMNADAYHTTVDLGDVNFISKIKLHDMNDVHEFTIEYFNGSDWVTLIKEPCDKFQVWKTYETAVETRYLRFSMYQSPYACVNEVLIYGYPILKDSEQIVINKSMISDKVTGGSVYPPTYMFDEQDIDIEANMHPISESWKPYYNETKAPYHTVVNLGTEYHITEIALHDMNSTYDFVVETSDDGLNWTILLTDDLNEYKVWQRHKLSVVTKYLRFTMLSSPYACVNEILVFGYPVMTLPVPVVIEKPLENQIVVTTNMVKDLVPGGSVDSPLYLFDEQLDVNPKLNQHPKSINWKPYYNNSRGPYYTEVDLQQEYHITKIYIHDTHSTYNFNVEYEQNSVWIPLFTEPLNTFNTWKLHEININARKLRLSMPDSPYAGVNEIILMGTPINGTAVAKGIALKNGAFTETSDSVNDKLLVYPNPVQDQMKLLLSYSDLKGQQEIAIVDILGNTIYALHLSTGAEEVEVDISNLQLAAGVYLAVYSNSQGQKDVVKFYKE